MSKYDVTLWSDYVRGLLDPATRNELSAYLELPGSVAARRTVKAFDGLLAFAARDAAAEPPASALRSVKALGSMLRPTRESWLRKLQSVLVFDSSMAPLAAGVRDLGHLDRQLIFRSDDYYVDLRLEQEATNSVWVVVGQLLREKDGVSPVAGVPVIAANDERFLSRSTTGKLGEFQAEGLPSADLRLLFLVDDELCLEVPVSNAPIAER